MYTGALRAVFTVPGAKSLKDKRAPLRSLKDRLRRRFNVSLAEVDAQDDRRRAVVGFALVDAEARGLRERVQALRRALETDPGLRLVSVEEALDDRFTGGLTRPDNPAGPDGDGPDDLLFADLVDG